MMRYKPNLTFILLLSVFCNLFFVRAASSAEVITSLFVDFPPYFTETKDGEVSGLAVDLLQAMGAVQEKYHFEFVTASPRRRHDVFYSRQLDISIIDNINWGWDQSKVEKTEVYMGGGERYISKNSSTKDQSYFKNFKAKRMGGILGFHYAFANFESTPSILHEMFNIELLKTQKQIIKMTLAGRIDVGVVTEAYLTKYLTQHPTQNKEILVSETYDQEYNFTAIRNKKSKISLVELQTIISEAVHSKKFRETLKFYGIEQDELGF